LTILLSFVFTTDTLAQGNLLITPRRVVFEGSLRSMDLNLANTGSDTATYAISIIQIRMNEDGGFDKIEKPDPGQQFADSYIRFFPRSVTLGPGEAQVVRVQLYRTNQLKSGEYRSHFYFRAVPDIKPLGEKAAAVVDTNTISVRLTPIFGITIPVIIRVGESTTSVSLSDLKLDLSEPDKPVFSFVFNRTGNMSVYGDLAIDYISPQGTTTRVGIANGVAVYTPNNVRKFSLRLNRIVGVDFHSGRLHLTYSASSDVKPAIYAESELSLK
jgi:P pilus assembly chaperone PapD